jgi:hypothetical protein
MSKTRTWAVVAALIVSGRVDAQLTQPELAKLVRPSVEMKIRGKDKDGKQVERDRRILQDRADSIVAYPAGAYPRPNCRVFDVPWDCQLYIESFRAYHPEEAAEPPFKDVLAKGDDLVAEQLSLIGKGGDDEAALKKQLMVKKDEFNKAFFAAVQEYAQAKGKKAQKGYGGAGTYNVEFRLVPKSAGAKATVVGVAFLEAAKAAGLSEKAGVWRDVEPEKITQLKYGDYFVRATWPDGGKTLKRLRVEKHCQVELEPSK